MFEKAEPVYMVSAREDPVILKINGCSNYLNCQPVADLFTRLIDQGKRNFVVDFGDCTAMDSTFLGILTGTALDLRNFVPPGSMMFIRLDKRNLEVVRNLGLHRLVDIDSSLSSLSFDPRESEEIVPTDSGKDQKATAEMILKAHQNLIQLKEGNREKFQDVISFLKEQLKDESLES